MHFYALTVVACAILIGEFFATKANKQTILTCVMNKTWLIAHKWRWLISIPLSIVSLNMSYTMSVETGTYSVHGFPLLVAAYDKAGLDYVHPFSFAFVIGNCVIWFFLPNLLLFAWAYFDKKAKQHA